MNKKVEQQKKALVTFNKNVLTILKELTPISEVVVMIKKKDEEGNLTDNVYISQANESEVLGYILNVPNNLLTFNGDKLAFQEFSEFFHLYSLFTDEPEIEQFDAAKLIIKGGSTKISLIVGEADVLDSGPEVVPFDKPDAVLTITSSQLLELRKKISLIKAEKVEITVEKKYISLRFFLDDNNNSIEETFAVNNEKTFHFITNVDMFVNVPKSDYTINFVQSGMVEMVHSSQIVDLRIYSGEVQS